MASPPSVTLHSMSGKWSMNSKLSDDFDGILEMQGLPWVLRRIAAIASVTLTVTQTTNADEVSLIEIKKTITGGLSAASESYMIDGSIRIHKDPMLGEMKGSVHWIKHGDVDVNVESGFLIRGIVDEGEELIHETVINEGRGWQVTQVWGFEQIDGVRRHVRHGVITKGKKTITARIVYDYVQPSK